MANRVFNVAKGRVAELHDRVNNSDPTNAVLVLWLQAETSSADDVMDDYATLAAVLAVETEATFTNYARIILDDTDVGPSTVDNTSNTRNADISDPTWSSAGGAANNILDKLGIGYDSDSTGGTDADIVPLTHHDFDVTTNGSDIAGQVAGAGYFQAA